MASKQRRTPVFPLEHLQQPSPVSHYAPKLLAALLVADALAAYLDRAKPSSGIVLKTREPWAALKARYRFSNSMPRPVPRILPPRRPENLDLSYPSPGFETCIHPHQAFVRACNQTFAQLNRAHKGLVSGNSGRLKSDMSRTESPLNSQ